MKLRALTFGILIASLASTPLYADPPHRYQARGGYTDRARVIDARPIVRIERVPVEHEECWDEDVVHRDRRGGVDKGVGLLAGAVIGGVLGNQVGHGRDRDAATVIGSVTGAVVGHELARGTGRYDTYRTVEQRCELVRDYREDEVVVGYDVTYRYHGRTYNRRMDHDPGKWVPVDVRVRPAY